MLVDNHNYNNDDDDNDNNDYITVSSNLTHLGGPDNSSLFY